MRSWSVWSAYDSELPLVHLRWVHMCRSGNWNFYIHFELSIYLNKCISYPIPFFQWVSSYTVFGIVRQISVLVDVAVAGPLHELFLRFFRMQCKPIFLLFCTIFPCEQNMCISFEQIYILCLGNVWQWLCMSNGWRNVHNGTMSCLLPLMNPTWIISRGYGAGSSDGDKIIPDLLLAGLIGLWIAVILGKIFVLTSRPQLCKLSWRYLLFQYQM